MWDLLRNRQFHSIKFLRQHVIRFPEPDFRQHFFIADFYCAQKKLVIEIDGTIHLQQKGYDQMRDLIMKELRLTVIRFSNEEVENNIGSVLESLKKILDSLPDFGN